MLNYLSELPDYARRLLIRVDTGSGILLGIVFFLAARPLGLGDGLSFIISAAIIAIAILEAGFALYRQEREMRAEREKELWIDARISKYSANIPDPGPDKMSMSITVLCAVWTSIDATTSNVGLNVIWGYRNHWWEFWKKNRVYKEGLPLVPETTTEFIRSLRAIDPQPIRWQFDFEYVADVIAGEDPHWFLELVVKTGIPPGTYRIPISLEHLAGPRITNPPL